MLKIVSSNLVPTNPNATPYPMAMKNPSEPIPDAIGILIKNPSELVPPIPDVVEIPMEISRKQVLPILDALTMVMN